MDPNEEVPLMRVVSPCVSIVLITSLGFMGCAVRKPPEAAAVRPAPSHDRTPTEAPHAQPAQRPARLGSVPPVTDIQPAGSNGVRFSVQYLNDTDSTFGSMTIRCRALDAEG